MLDTLIALAVVAIVAYVAEARGRSGIRWGLLAVAAAGISLATGFWAVAAVVDSSLVFSEDRGLGMALLFTGPALCVLSGGVLLTTLTRLPAQPGLDRARSIDVWVATPDAEEARPGRIEVDAAAFRITVDGPESQAAEIHRGKLSDVRTMAIDGEVLDVAYDTPAGAQRLSLRARGDLEDRAARVRVIEAVEKRLGAAAES